MIIGSEFALQKPEPKAAPKPALEQKEDKKAPDAKPLAANETKASTELP